MKKGIVLLVTVFIGLQLIKNLLLWDYKASYGTSRIEILVNGASSQKGKEMSDNQIENDYQVAISSYKENLIVESEKADIIAVNTYWHQVQRPQMLEGTLWGEEADDEGRKYAVISDTLAIKLWGSEKVLGNIIHMEHQIYEVTGVYKRYKNIRQYQLDDGREKIYIPLKSSLSCEWPVQFMVIDSTNQKVVPDEKDLWGMGLASNNDTVCDRGEWFKHQKSLIQQPIRWLWFLTLPFVIGIVKKIIQDHEKTWEKKGLIIGGILLFMLILFKICMWGFYINPSQLPSENIFDLTFYWNSLLKEWSNHNQLIRCPASQFEGAYYGFKYWSYFINSLQIIIEISIVYGNKNFIDKMIKVN